MKAIGLEKHRTDNPNEDQTEVINDLLTKYNIKQPAHIKSRTYMIEYKDDKDDLLGGAIFEITGDFLSIDTLVIARKFRKKGYGRQILEEIENIAHNENHCKMIGCGVFEFQNSSFLQKNGYKIDYIELATTNKAKWLWFTKRFE